MLHYRLPLIPTPINLCMSPLLGPMTKIYSHLLGQQLTRICATLYIKRLECRGIVSQTLLLSNFKLCELVLPWVAAVDTNGSCGWAASFCKEQRCSSTAMSAVSSARAQLSGAFSSEQRAAAHSGAEKTESVEQRAPMGKLLRLL